MDIKVAYDLWSAQYDTNQNKTRDLEALALQDMSSTLSFEKCLEMGCGTGKNTVWLATKATHVTAVDFSEQMLAKAQEKVNIPHVRFIQADISQPWKFAEGKYNLITFSLVLEHMENLDVLFEKANQVLAPGGSIYVGELHPFEQYTGTKARFESPAGRTELTCFTHHVSDFTNAALQQGLQVEHLQEFFDEEDRTSIPRILAILFRKAQGHQGQSPS